MISLDKCNGSCNPVDDLSTNEYALSGTKDVTVKVFNMITEIDEVKTLVKHISYDCKCKFDSRTCTSNQKLKNGKSQCEWKKYHRCKKDHSWNPSTSICVNSRCENKYCWWLRNCVWWN